VALVAGYFGGPIAYAAVKQELNKQAGFQNGYNLRDFAVDAATYAITSEIVGGAGEAAGVGEVIARGAAAATINAGIRGAVYEYDKQRGVSKANRGGSAFSFQDLGVDITATAVTAGFAKELKVTDVNNQLVNAFTRSAKNIVVKDLIARAVYDDYLEKQGGSFLFRTLQGGLTNYTNTALATYSPQEQTKPGEKDLYDRATEFFFGAEDMLTQNNQLAALQQKTSQPSGPPEGAPSLNNMQASAYGIEPGAIVDVGAGNILGGIDGVSFDENMRARLGVETVGLSDLDALPITTDSPDSLAYLEASNRLSVAGSDQTSHPDAQYLEDAIASGDVLVRGFNETEAVITNEALSYGDVSSKEYEIDYADYESINQATYELDLFDFDVANGFAESKEINPFTQLFGDISSSLTEYGNYASVSFDEAVTATNEKLGEFANGISDNQEGLNAFYDGVKVEASNDGNLPKYLAASFGQSFGNFGYNIVGFGANLLGDQTRAAEQWDDFGEYSLETSEGTNALELEGGIGVNFFGNQVSIGLSFGADNQGRVDIALGFNHEPNTDVLGFEFLAGVNVAKAWGVDSVNDLVSGHSAAYDGFVSGQYVAGAEASYGQGLLFTDKGDVPFAQVGIAVTIEDPVESPVWGGVGVDYEYAISSSQFLTAEERGYDWGWAGKAIYGLVNLTYGNGIDAVASNRNNGVTVPSNRENR
jgi:hypothetical protein